MDNFETIAKRLRATLRSVGFETEAVSWIKRSEDTEFAAIVCPTAPGFEDVYLRALDFLTDPRQPMRVTREHVGRYDIRIYVAASVAS